MQYIYEDQENTKEVATKIIPNSNKSTYQERKIGEDRINILEEKERKRLSNFRSQKNNRFEKV